MFTKKKVRKVVTKLLPKGVLKDKMKCIWYNFFSKSHYSFHINNTGEYLTKYRNFSVVTKSPLYHVVKDFDFYQHFYKVKPEDIVIDAGANEGFLSLIFSKLVEDKGFVFSFEPDSFNIQKFISNMEVNASIKNIKIEDLLLWDKNAYIDFYETGSVASSAHWIPENVISTKKEAITLDSWAVKNNITKIDFIKMDIEGAEIEAVEGCREIINNFKPNFAIASYHIVNNEPTYIRIEKFFKSIGYPCKTIKFNTTEIITFAGENI
jgi:FkbM family methyltransferase